jgi:hypothetical protein
MNMMCFKANGKGIDIQGLAEKPIHHVTLENITVISEAENSAAINTENGETFNVNTSGADFSFDD